MPATRAGFGFVVLWLFADGAVEFLAHVQRLHAIEEHLLKVLGEAQYVPRVVKQDAVRFAGVRAGAQAPAPHLDGSREALAQGSAVHHTADVRHVEALGESLHADQHTQAGVRLGKLAHQRFAFAGGGFAGEHGGQHPGAYKLRAQLLSVGNRAGENDGLAVLCVLHPFVNHVADDFHAALLGGLVAPFAGFAGGGTSHIGPGAGQHAHWHQHARFGQLVHGGGVDQSGEHLAQSLAEWRCSQANHHGGRVVAGVLNPAAMHRVALVHNNHVCLRPELALGNRLGAGDLERQAAIAAWVSGLDDAVRCQASSVSGGAGLVDKRRAVGQKHHALTAQQGFEGHAQRQHRFACTGRCAHQLAAVALYKALAQRLVG